MLLKCFKKTKQNYGHFVFRFKTIQIEYRISKFGWRETTPIQQWELPVVLENLLQLSYRIVMFWIRLILGLNLKLFFSSFLLYRGIFFFGTKSAYERTDYSEIFNGFLVVMIFFLTVLGSFILFLFVLWLRERFCRTRTIRNH